MYDSSLSTTFSSLLGLELFNTYNDLITSQASLEQGAQIYFKVLISIISFFLEHTHLKIGNVHYEWKQWAW